MQLQNKSIKFLNFIVQQKKSLSGYLSEEKNSTYGKGANSSDVTWDAEKHFTDATDGALNESVSTEVMVTTEKTSKI